MLKTLLEPDMVLVTVPDSVTLIDSVTVTGASFTLLTFTLKALLVRGEQPGLPSETVTVTTKLPNLSSAYLIVIVPVLFVTVAMSVPVFVTV